VKKLLSLCAVVALSLGLTSCFATFSIGVNTVTDDGRPVGINVGFSVPVKSSASEKAPKSVQPVQPQPIVQ
jgi:hypothetical protein